MKPTLTKLFALFGIPFTKGMKWKIVRSLDHQYGQQDKAELDWMLKEVSGVSSILEVGSCFGHTLRAMAHVAQPRALIRSIDLGMQPWPFEGIDTSQELKIVISGLKNEGYDVEFLHADSHASSAVDWARRNAPYDFVFIDGDHSAEGVRADWNDYGPMGRVVGFHDIADEVVGTLWKEIKSVFPKTKEVINSNKGIGLVVR